jgi:hypothetical protein
MEHKRSLKSFVLVFIIIIVVTGCLIFAYKAKVSGGAYSPVVFQPEGQMVLQATQPGMVAVLSASDVKELSSVPGYAYSADTCVNSTSTDTEYSCFASYYKNLVMDHGVDLAFADIKTRYSQVPIVTAECHPLMHVIGQAASIIYPVISDAYLHGDSFCWSGYYHGILEGVAFKIGKKNLPAQINTICSNIPGKETYNFEYFNCVHGLGHGIMELNKDDVPASLGICDDLNGEWEKESCYGGIFMENIIADNLNHDSKYLKTDDLLYPCDVLADKYKGECYLVQTSYALERSNYDFKKVSDLCTTVAGSFRDTCFQSYGRDAANQSRHDAVSTKALCYLSADANDGTNCVIGAVKEMVSYYDSNVQAQAFCNILNDHDKAICSATDEQYYSHF